MKFLRVALCFFLVFALVGCASASVEDLLMAPALSDGQKQVLQSLSAGVGTDKIVLRYPRFGSSRAPIQFADLDADGSDEAVAFFSSTRKIVKRAFSARRYLFSRIDSWAILQS